MSRYSMSAFDERILSRNGFDRHQFVGRNAEFVHDELELGGDGTAHDIGLSAQLRLQHPFEAGHCKPGDDDLAEQQDDRGEQDQPTKGSARAGDALAQASAVRYRAFRRGTHTASSSSSRRISVMAESMSP